LNLNDGEWQQITLGNTDVDNLRDFVDQFHKMEFVVNSTKALDLIPNFLDFFRRLYAPVSNHVIPVLTLADLPP
jgi:hypothetical protein